MNTDNCIATQLSQKNPHCNPAKRVDKQNEHDERSSMVNHHGWITLHPFIIVLDIWTSDLDRGNERLWSSPAFLINRLSMAKEYDGSTVHYERRVKDSLWSQRAGRMLREGELKWLFKESNYQVSPPCEPKSRD